PLDETERPIRVGIALVGRAGYYLIRQRPPGSAMAGYWEFPGGKCEAGESPEDATVRECREEIGLGIVLGPLRRRMTHRYPHAWVELFYFDGTTESPEAEPSAETGFRWVRAGDLPSLTFPEANGPILEELADEARAT
ncbi:(deoxy)nucleoside triphosphate pyrophosphohydrolase, partial [Singulisphaera rosea]